MIINFAVGVNRKLVTGIKRKLGLKTEPVLLSFHLKFSNSHIIHFRIQPAQTCLQFNQRMFSSGPRPVVQRVDNFIQRIRRYTVDKMYKLENVLFGG